MFNHYHIVMILAPNIHLLTGRKTAMMNNPVKQTHPHQPSSGMFHSTPCFLHPCFTLLATPLFPLPDATVPAYTWNQTTEDISAQFTLPPGVGKADIVYRLTPETVELGVKNGETLLKGELHSHVEPDSCTWTLQDQR